MVARSAAAQIPDVRRFDRRILRYLNEFRRSIASSVMIGMVGSAFAALQPWPIKLLIDGVLVAEPEAAAWLDYVPAVAAGPIAISAVLAAGFVLFAGLEALCNATAFYLMARTALEMIHRLRMRLLAHVYSLSLRFHTNTPVGDTIWRAINDARSIQELLIIGVRTCTVLVFRVLAMLALMLLIDVPLTLASILMLPLLYVAIAVLSPRIQRASIRGRERMGRLTALIEQGLVAIRAVQTSGAEDFERGRLERASLDFVRTQLRFRLAERSLAVATVCITALGTAVVLVLTTTRVQSGDVSVGSLWVFVAYMGSLHEMLKEIMSVYGPFQDARIGVGRVLELLDERPELADAPDAIAPRSFERSIVLRDVHLRYDRGDPVLRGVDLEIPRGSKLAIVGESGAGKTSLLHVIARLVEASAGSVAVDGVDVRKLKLASWRALVSFVPQDGQLLDDTVRDMIRYGRPDASDAEVQRAARAVHAHAFIEALPAGYDTEVGEGGTKLSSGQKQRLALARALLRGAPILLLDEPTATFDLETEAQFLERLMIEAADRTLVIASHRLGSLRRIERICYLESGRIVEQGSHAELMALGGRYRRLYERQLDGRGPSQPEVPRIGVDGGAP